MTKTNQEEKFWNDKEIVKEFFEYPKDQYWQDILSKYKSNNRQKALDLGCGGGRNTETLIDAGYDVHGCDYYQEMVKATRQRLKQKFNKTFHLRITQANMISLPYQDNEFNLIISNGVFHNAFTPKEFDKALNEVKR